MTQPIIQPPRQVSMDLSNYGKPKQKTYEAMAAEEFRRLGMPMPTPIHGAIPSGLSPVTKQSPLDMYNTPLTPEQASQYRQWLKEESMRQGRDVSRDAADYDTQGYFLANQSSDSRGHATDQFKKPNHPTFSDESQYNGQGGAQGGHWTDTSFQASPTNLENYQPGELRRYFKENEPGVRLVLPSTPRR